MCDVVNYCYAHIHACCICQFMCFCSIVAVCLLFSIHYLIPGRGAKYCHPCICLSSVCRFLSSLHVYISQKSLVQISGNFLYILPVAKAWSSSDDRAICYVIPVLQMTPSFSYNGTNGLELRYCCFFEFFSGSTSQTLDSVIIFRRICQTAIPGTKLVSTIAGLLYNNQVMMWNDIDACVLCL